MTNEFKHIVLFASGNGTNAEHIVKTFKNHPSIKVVAVFCNNPKAGVIERIKPYDIPVQLFDKKMLNDADIFINMLKPYQPNLLVLAGFLWLIPTYLIQFYPKEIINIHPALLPKFGGKGMYGQHIHQAVLNAKETEHGITIHFVNEHYDEGEHIVQAKFNIEANDNLQIIQQRISALEFAYYPEAIKRVLGVYY
ncbi:MAG: phosphoribosylglycinamide formyltransferase [Bacteroidia bacterium]|jgi:phosphoribosylglycinamide formyltransferase 1|nr:phosphoribosylglycinamide formyltransferase [Bacteroidia bacterium]